MASPLSSPTLLPSRLLACLGEGDMTDVFLLANDDVKVPAFRNILACQSDVFRKMLYGDFQEAESNVVKLDYKSDVLKVMVEFCITGRVRLRDPCESAARLIVQLIACSHFLDMPHLEAHANKEASTLLEDHKSLVCTLYDEASALGHPTESIKLDALNTARKNPKECLLSKPGILSLGVQALPTLIADDEMDCEEITMFKAINEWTRASANGFSQKERMNIARDLTDNFIHLPSIGPSYLTSVVRESHLVDESEILKTLETQALLAENVVGVKFSRKRKINSQDDEEKRFKKRSGSKRQGS